MNLRLKVYPQCTMTSLTYKMPNLEIRIDCNPAQKLANMF